MKEGIGMENIHQGHREKMRQRFLKSGLESFADHEALELLLYYAIPRRDTNPIAHRLMERYGSLTAVLSAPAEDLKKVEGIGICELTDQDVVRHVMVQRIIKAYADYEDARNEKRKR